MWIKPGYQPDRQVPPRERGRRLAAFKRGRDQELRVCLDEYEGRPYLSLRVWELDDAGGWWPSKRGVSVRLHEAPVLANVLAELAKSPHPGQAPERPQASPGVPRRPRPRTDWFDSLADLRGASGSEPFDEFYGQDDLRDPTENIRESIPKSI